MKNKKSNFMDYKLLCTSLNAVGLINLCNTNGIRLKNVSKVDSGTQFEMSAKDYISFQKLNTNNYTIVVIRQGGYKIILHNVLYRIGLIVGVIICFLGMIFINNRLLQVHVSGLENITKEEVVEYLKTQGINTFSLMNFDTKNLERSLVDKFDFSLISIITKGNSLIISVKESLPGLEDSYVAITADYNMVIDSINVYSGTGRVKAGEIVYKGDVLVEPYIISGDSKVFVTPCAEIVAKVFYSASYRFLTTEKVKIRTGKKQLVSIDVNLGQFTIYSSNIDDSKYADFETEEIESQVSHYYLPIMIHKNYAYELVEDTISRDFEIEKESIVASLKKDVYSQLPEGLKAEDESVNIIPITEGYLVNVSITSTITMNYEYHG